MNTDRWLNLQEIFRRALARSPATKTARVFGESQGYGREHVAVRLRPAERAAIDENDSA